MPRRKGWFHPSRWRWLQRLSGIHRIHHPRWSHGWRIPFGNRVRFDPQRYVDGFSRDAHWENCAPDSYHDCTATGRY